MKLETKAHDMLNASNMFWFFMNDKKELAVVSRRHTSFNLIITNANGNQFFLDRLKPLAESLDELNEMLALLNWKKFKEIRVPYTVKVHELNNTQLRLISQVYLMNKYAGVIRGSNLATSITTLTIDEGTFKSAQGGHYHGLMMSFSGAPSILFEKVCGVYTANIPTKVFIEILKNVSSYGWDVLLV